MPADESMIDEKASESLAVAPPPPGGAAGEESAGTPEIRDAHDAGDSKRLQRDPSDEDAKLDVALDESFPTSDAPSNTQPGKGKDPAPSSGYDEAAERARAVGLTRNVAGRAQSLLRIVARHVFVLRRNTGHAPFMAMSR